MVQEGSVNVPRLAAAKRRSRTCRANCDTWPSSARSSRRSKMTPPMPFARTRRLSARSFAWLLWLGLLFPVAQLAAAMHGCRTRGGEPARQGHRAPDSPIATCAWWLPRSAAVRRRPIRPPSSTPRFDDALPRRRSSSPPVARCTRPRLPEPRAPVHPALIRSPSPVRRLAGAALSSIPCRSDPCTSSCPRAIALRWPLPPRAPRRRCVRSRRAARADGSDARRVRGSPAGARARACSAPRPRIARARIERATAHSPPRPPAAAAAAGAAAPPLAVSRHRSAAAAAPVAARGGGANAFNPSMSLILSGLYTRTSQDPSRYAITGFPLPPEREIGPGTRGFSLAESELGLAASIDPWLRGAANISFAVRQQRLDRGGVRADDLARRRPVAEGRTVLLRRRLPQPAALAHLGLRRQPARLPGDARHPVRRRRRAAHLARRRSTSTSSSALELGRGRSFPGTDTGRNGAGMVAVTAHTGGDIGDSSSWRAGSRC